jgi:hypothetical protein
VQPRCCFCRKLSWQKAIHFCETKEVPSPRGVLNRRVGLPGETLLCLQKAWTVCCPFGNIRKFRSSPVGHAPSSGTVFPFESSSRRYVPALAIVRRLGKGKSGRNLFAYLVYLPQSAPTRSYCYERMTLALARETFPRLLSFPQFSHRLALEQTTILVWSFHPVACTSPRFRGNLPLPGGIAPFPRWTRSTHK